MLNVLKDPLRRILLEYLAQGPYSTVALANITGAEYDDVRNRVRGLLNAFAIIHIRDHTYRAVPYPANCIRRYFDVLLTAAVYTHGVGIGFN